MGPMEIMWTITGVMVPLLLGTAWAMLGLSPPEFWIARGSTLVAALIFTASSIVWISNIQWPTSSRVLIAAALGLAALIGFSECLRWVNHREIIFLAQQRSAADKRASIRAKLQQFYVESGPLLNRNLPKNITDADFQKYENEVNVWVNTTARWIQQNLGDAATAKFTDVGGGFRVWTHNLIQ